MPKQGYKTDVALLTVTTTEFAGVMHFHDWKAKTVSGEEYYLDGSGDESG